MTQPPTSGPNDPGTQRVSKAATLLKLVRTEEAPRMRGEHLQESETRPNAYYTALIKRTLFHHSFVFFTCTLKNVRTGTVKLVGVPGRTR